MTDTPDIEIARTDLETLRHVAAEKSHEWLARCAQPQEWLVPLWMTHPEGPEFAETSFFSFYVWLQLSIIYLYLNDATVVSHWHHSQGIGLHNPLTETL